jgi:hypothetical protein
MTQFVHKIKKSDFCWITRPSFDIAAVITVKDTFVHGANGDEVADQVDYFGACAAFECLYVVTKLLGWIRNQIVLFCNE